MNERIEQKTGFKQVRNDIKALCLGAGGRFWVDEMAFSDDFSKVEYNLNLTFEFRNIILSNQNFPSDSYYDMREELHRLRLAGTFIDRAHLFDLKRSLHTINDCIAFLDDRKDDFPQLYGLSVGLEVDKNLLKRCDMLLDADGEFYDNASEELQRIRIARKHKKAEIERHIRKILSLSKSEGWTNDDAEITIRNGRPVIPVSSANKRRIKGFVHDYSASGNTSYIEPSEVVELNNEVRELDFEEQREIIRILTEVSDMLRPDIDVLLSDYIFLSQMDFIRAKALYAVKIKAGLPILVNKPQIDWYDARHPLLEASLALHHKKIVPLRIELTKHRILVISGPNAGGKSVCLKTTGLLQYMLQCGLLVPMRETSEAGIFGAIFIDIGDEQSLEDDLSTYSSHLLNMKRLCEQANGRTLFLIDEFGSGTDPEVGGAIAEAILEDLNASKAFGVVTTHYSKLKLISDKAANHGTIVNGAMLFDKDNMKPLYVLSIGKPGSSFAFEIAKSIGLPKRIIESAVEKTGSGIMDFEQQLQQIEVEKQELKRKEEQFEVADNLLAETIAKYEKMFADVSNRKSEIINKAKHEAKQILEGANQRIEKTIADIRTANAQKELTNAAREKIKQDIVKIDADLSSGKSKNNSAQSHTEPQKQIHNVTIRFDSSPIVEGDNVLLSDGVTFAQVLRLKRDKVEVIFGNIAMSLPLSDVKKVDKKSYQRYKSKKTTSEKRSFNSIMDDINKKRAVFKYQIDVRGEKADQALEIVSKQVDEARLLGERQFAVLHGKGDGILKSVIREFLKNNSAVEAFRPAALESGGEGITVVKLY
ncbi:MAG: Smr/MutS family protein [Bacteroidales bacterium]|jgi:DNA mismatch repair protein MutS2|nr:Smr/MutS family protein [Bacteroidales bacterium]